MKPVQSLFFRIESMQKQSGLPEEGLFANIPLFLMALALRWYWHIIEENWVAQLCFERCNAASVQYFCYADVRQLTFQLQKNMAERALIHLPLTVVPGYDREVPPVHIRFFYTRSSDDKMPEKK